MSEVTIPIPWKLLFGLGRNVVERKATSVDAFTEAVCQGISPTPLIEGLENLPESPRFVLAANHYQRKGLWILFPAAVMTRIIRERYGPGDPPVRWMVTANWPRIRLGPFRFRSPGDILLPRVADALDCYPVSFAGSNQAYTAKSIRRILREVPKASRPLGIFPEGVGGSASVFGQPIPGVERLIVHLAKSGMPVVPVCVSERGGQLVFRVGRLIGVQELVEVEDAGRLVLERVRASEQ